MLRDVQMVSCRVAVADAEVSAPGDDAGPDAFRTPGPIVGEAHRLLAIGVDVYATSVALEPTFRASSMLGWLLGDVLWGAAALSLGSPGKAVSVGPVGTRAWKMLRPVIRIGAIVMPLVASVHSAGRGHGAYPLAGTLVPVGRQPMPATSQHGSLVDQSA